MTGVRFPDPQPAVRDVVRRLLASRQEPEAEGVTVSTKLHRPDDPLPHVAIRLDGQVRDSRLNGRATIRVTVWHRDEGLALSLAGLIEALLLAPGLVDAKVRGCSPVAGPIPETDPDTDLPLSFFTTTARLRPTNL